MVENYLVESRRCHRLMALELSPVLHRELRKKLVDFFWSVLYFVWKGGQGLVDLAGCIGAFRMKRTQRLLQRVDGLGYDRHLLGLDLMDMVISVTTLFYQSVLMWSSVLWTDRPGSQVCISMEEEPLL